MSTLPVEIIGNIVDNLAGDTASLAACTLATKALLPPARALLFREIHLSFPAAPARLLRLLAASPYLIKVVSYLEISVDATISDDLEPLLSIFRGPPDSEGRYHGAGPLRSVALVKIILRDLSSPLRHVILALLSCSSITSITVHSVDTLFLSSCWSYLSPSLCNLNLYTSNICSIYSLPPDDVPGPLTKAIHPASVSSMDFFGMASAVFILSKFSPPLKLSSMRVSILEPDATWLYYAMIFPNASTVLSSLHTLSLIFAPIGKSYHSDTVQVFGWIGINLSDPPFNNVRTLKVYADSTDEVLPLYYSLCQHTRRASGATIITLGNTVGAHQDL